MARSVNCLLTIVLMMIAIIGNTQPVPLDIPGDSKNFKTIGDVVYFVTTDGTLYRTDGTHEGTLLLKRGGNPNPLQFTEFTGMAFWFEAGAFWRSDGTPSGTIPLTSSALTSAQVLDTTENHMFVSATSPTNGNEVWRTDGTVAGTTLLKDVNPGSADGFRGFHVVRGNELFFTGDDGLTGTELWKTDGTTAGTLLVKDVNPGSPDGVTGALFATESLIFFGGNNGTHGTELWKTDGSSAGTVMVKEVVAGAEGGFGGGLQAASNKFYFRGSFPGNTQLWVTDGTEAGTMFLKHGDVHPMINTNERLFFYSVVKPEEWINRIELWRTDGTPASTIKLGTLCDDCMFARNPLLTYNDKLFFVAEDYNGLTQYVWKTDGTEAGTEIIFSDFLDGYIPFFDIVNDFLFFYTTSQGNTIALYTIDLTGAGRPTVSRPFKSGEGGGEVPMAAVGDFVFFVDHDGPSDGSMGGSDDAFQLLQTDGSTVISLRDMFGTSYQHTSQIINYNGKALFPTGVNPKEWWIYDPIKLGAGQIQQEIWTGVPGTKTSAIPVNTTPSSVSDLTIFETASDIGDNYGSRVRGFVIAPQTGDYTFWISSDDQGELWLSTDEDPANKTKIAEVTGWTNPQQWDKYASQKSPARRLVGGQKYYIEALLKEGTGRDHLAVGWQVPDGTLERPIPGTRLISFDAPKALPKITIASPYEGRTFDAPADITISAVVDGSISKVEFYNDAVLLGEDTTDPFSFIWNDVTAGSYMLIAKAIDADGKSDADTVNVIVTGGACAGAGMIRQEFWTNVTGTRISNIPLNEEPDFTQDLTIFEGPASAVGDNYGTRIRGYICPPATGTYIFWIAGDDQVELSLSTDDNPANKRRIAYHTGWTNKRDWTKYATQQSVSITLQAGRRYYIEALMKEGTGGDHVSVGWQMPNGTLQRPIAGSNLIPFGASDPDPDPTCAGTGSISVETWTGIDGTQVSSIPVNSSANLTGERNIFEAPTNIGNNFGSRFRGYVCVPTSGNYTFWIASDDHSELWLSPDADPANKRRIAYHSGWTLPRQWTKYTTQQSAPISLVAGQQYYIEALYKEDEGADNMAVGWQLPDGIMERPIPGNRLSPFEATSATMASQSISSERKLYEHISVYPNPAKSGDPELTISGYEGIEETVETQVEIINMTGEVVFAEQIQCGGNCGSYLMNVNKQLVPGVYTVNMKTNGTWSSKRLFVK